MLSCCTARCLRLLPERNADLPVLVLRMWLREWYNLGEGASPDVSVSGRSGVGALVLAGGPIGKYFANVSILVGSVPLWFELAGSLSGGGAFWTTPSFGVTTWVPGGVSGGFLNVALVCNHRREAGAAATFASGGGGSANGSCFSCVVPFANLAAELPLVMFASCPFAGLAGPAVATPILAVALVETVLCIWLASASSSSAIAVRIASSAGAGVRRSHSLSR